MSFDYEKLESYYARFDDAYWTRNETSKRIEKEYYALSLFFQEIFLDDDTKKVNDTNNRANIERMNFCVLYTLLRKIDDHPILWNFFRRFFSIL